MKITNVKTLHLIHKYLIEVKTRDAGFPNSTKNIPAKNFYSGTFGEIHALPSERPNMAETKPSPGCKRSQFPIRCPSHLCYMEIIEAVMSWKD